MLLSLTDDYNRESRTLVWSQRRVQNFIYNSCLYEFEDITGDLEQANVISPQQYNFLGRGVKKLVKSQTKKFPLLTNINPYRRTVSLENEYDVLFTVIDFPWNLSSINLLDNWRNKSKFAVCYLI